MTLRDIHRRAGLILVDIDDQYVLVDQDNECIHTLNGAAAWVWAHLGTDTSVPEALARAFRGFLGELRQRRLLGAGPNSETVKLDVAFRGQPRILATAPLQVAANNSPALADPFFEEF